MTPKWRRVLIKLSGEALKGHGEYGIDGKTVTEVATELKQVHAHGVEVAVVIGGGNIFRGKGVELKGLDRSTADYMGMLATLINAMGLQSCLERMGVEVRVMSALPIASVCEPYVRRRAVSHLSWGRIVIFAGGTGNPFFTTDSAAALRASEVNCQALLKATKVGGVYSGDPLRDKNAERYEFLSYDDMLQRHLGVMDATAVTLAAENDLPILVFAMTEPGQLVSVATGQGGRFTLIARNPWQGNLAQGSAGQGKRAQE